MIGQYQYGFKLGINNFERDNWGTHIDKVILFSKKKKKKR